MNAKVNPFLFESAALTYLPGLGNIRSLQKAGYLSVGDAAGGWLYFWFGEATDQPESAPLLVWINSNPESNALSYLFGEHGPYQIDGSGRIRGNPFSWLQNVNYLIIDQPLGHGLSFASHERYLPESHDEACQQLYHALQEFLLRWPAYRQLDCYLFGSGWAGHTLTRLANCILDGNGNGQPPIALRGIGLGNARIAPEIQLESDVEYAYQHRLINLRELEQARDMLRHFDDLAASDIPLQRKQACRLVAEIEQFILQCSGRSAGDIRLPPQQADNAHLKEYLAKPAVRQALHIDPRTENQAIAQQPPLQDAFRLETSSHLFPRLLNELKILLYQGEYSLEGNYLGIDAWLNTLQWRQAEAFRNQKREAWRPYGLSAGLIREYQSLTHVIIQNAGQRVARDQPAVAQAMLKAFLGRNAGAAENDKRIDRITLPGY
ncbi:S10 family peptidase [Chromobacterium sp. IIBBL 290-4]|uniref:S10 family peptidase n=1 Tax=Chromobacterium sp. IIBBL 290-4 TaxID=2953890 RepID=UPI0020B82874|nr:S10 family peptidase [Chromobacterium sp. IIBBL 290-4]UTH73069.1 S10 family peptidase [Chromobacterium sp. IIBBL 290-4]